MPLQSGYYKHQRRLLRRGASTIELAIATPFLLLLIMGLIDVGQLANVAQTVTNSSRVGARMAARNEVTATSSVVSSVEDYIKSAFPGVSDSDINSALTVNVLHQDGTAISGGNLDNVPLGAGLKVEVTLQFGAVRWLGAVDLLGLANRQIKKTTVMRRE